MVTQIQGTQALATEIRLHSLEMAYRSRASHNGSCPSAADMSSVSYGRVLTIGPFPPSRTGHDGVNFGDRLLAAN